MTQDGHWARLIERLHNAGPNPFQSAGLSRYDAISEPLGEAMRKALQWYTA